MKAKKQFLGLLNSLRKPLMDLDHAWLYVFWPVDKTSNLGINQTSANQGHDLTILDKVSSN